MSDRSRWSRWSGSASRTEVTPVTRFLLQGKARAETGYMADNTAPEKRSRHLSNSDARHLPASCHPGAQFRCNGRTICTRVMHGRACSTPLRQEK